MVQPLQKVVWYFSKTVLPYDPAISLLGIYLKKKKTNSKRHIHPNVDSSIIHNCRMWKQLMRPSVDEWIKKRGYTTESEK